jgi:hypothetical protein
MAADFNLSWTSAQQFPTKSGPALLKIKNPDGSTDGLIFDVHSKPSPQAKTLCQPDLGA